MNERIAIRHWSVLLLTLITAHLISASEHQEQKQWWRDAVFYQIFVRSFQDASTGPYADDGIGDFRGLIERLDYINDGDPQTDSDLGATALWLLPIHPSPSYHGYDVTDYFAVNPDYGDLELFKEFLSEAHKRGIKVIIDLVLNHTSTEHPWFEQAIREDIESPYQDYFRFATSREQAAGPWGEPAWHYMNGIYYYGVFWSGMPDWNFNNKAVVEHHKKAARFWIEEVGVDGFRLDAVRFFFEDEDLLQDTDETKEWLREYREYVQGLNPEAVIIGEVWADTEQVASYVDRGAVDTAFEFDLAEAMVESAKFNVGKVFVDRLRKVQTEFDQGPWCSFLSNHDKERTLSQLEGDLAKAKLAATIQTLNTGIPFIYYGEEIGMQGRKPDPSLRTPMQWSDKAFAGFSVTDPWMRVNEDFTAVNVEAQWDDPDALLTHYRKLIRARQASPSLVYGELIPVEIDGRSLFAQMRATDEEATLLLVNFRSRENKKWNLTVTGSPLRGEWQLEELLHEADLQAPEITEEGGFSNWQPLEELEPQTGYLIRWRKP